MLFTLLVGGFIAFCLLGWKIVHDAQVADRKRPRRKKRDTTY